MHGSFSHFTDGSASQYATLIMFASPELYGQPWKLCGSRFALVVDAAVWCVIPKT